ncbi:MAG: hypothetical protein JO257_28770 [Deltaproteobacteria bacterium]|nr:hypothetical protein [Deltaproteobacteria bacterium]
MIRLAVLLVAACGTHARPVPLPAPKPVGRAPSVAAVAGELPAAPVVRSDDGRGGADAPPAGPITLIAVTADGRAAVTADEGGGLRLWPALDGTKEPRVVVAPQAHQLALARRGDGFTIGVLDAGGGLVIANVDGEGRARSHATLPTEPAFLGIAMTAAGLLAWRADQIAVLLDADGAPIGQLGTQPGERLVTIAERGGHAMALLERAGKRGMRSLTVGAAMAWGDWVEVGDVADLLAIAPDGRHVVVQRKDIVVVLDIKGQLVDEANALSTDRIDWLDDTTLVYATRSGLAFHVKARTVGPRGSTGAVLAVGGGHAVAAAGSELAIATPAHTQYLGYGVVSPSVAQPAIDGQLVIGLGDSFVTLDRSLHEVGEPTFPVPASTEVADLRWLGGDAWAVEASHVGNGETFLVLVGGGKSKVVEAGRWSAHVMSYEPSTHLLTLSLGNAPAVYRFDPGKLELARIAALPSETSTQTELVPLAPARAGGMTILHLTLHAVTTARWLRDPAKLKEPTTSVTLAAGFAGADSAGHVFGWEPGDGAMRLVVFEQGRRVGVLPANGRVSVWPAPTGERLLEIGAHDVSLLSVAGKLLWSTPIEGATQGSWLSDGGVAIITAAGIARLDPATGAIVAARCGWEFSLATAPHPPTPKLEPVCAGLEAGH